MKRSANIIKVRALSGSLGLFALLIAGSFSASYAQRLVGIVVKNSGSGQIKHLNGEIAKISSQNFVNGVSIGQSLKTEGKGHLVIRLCNGKLVTIGGTWYTVPRVLCPTTGSAKISVLEDFFGVGARYHKPNRGDEEFILFPFEKSLTIIRPETATFRWTPVGGRLSLSVKAADGDKPVWSGEADGPAGSFSSDGLKNALRSAGSKNAAAKFRLKIVISSLSSENVAEFQLFSPADEIQLQNALSLLNSEPPLYRYLARAKVYSDLSLFVEAANEYEAALKLSPESPSLLNAVASAEDAAGNLSKRDEILERIKKGSK